MALLYKSVDVMKKTKDVMATQLSDAEIANLVACIKTTGATHIAISCPMDTDAQMRAAGTTPAPRTAEAHIQAWCDAIHAAGLKVIHRGTFSGTEAIWGFSQIIFGTGTALAIGTSGSAAADGENSFCGRIRRYILTTVGATHWADGDLFCPIPEGTQNAFNGKNWWDGTSDSTGQYAAAFIAFKATAAAAFTSISKSVTFMSHNNFSEVRSGWVPASLFSDQNIAGFDYYGQYQGTLYNNVADYITDIATVCTNTGKSAFWGEWGDLPNAMPAFASLNIYDRLNFLQQFYKSIQTNLVDTGKLIGYNYWGGWEGQNTSILIKTGSNYTLNARGKMLQAFFNNRVPARLPVLQSGSSDLDYA
jgi:hypothetical protein